MTDQTPIERNEALRQLSQRSLHLVTATLLLVIIVLAGSVLLGVGVTRNAQHDRDRVAATLAASNDEIAAELACRADIVNQHEVLKGDLVAAIADLIIGTRTGQPADILNALADHIEQVTAELNNKSAERLASVDTCAHS